MAAEPCGVCGGDGRIHNAFGLTNTCPACHGTGRRDEAGSLMRDVTKTKPSHYAPTNRAPVAEKKPDWPVSLEGSHLATEVRDCGTLSSETRARLIREIVEYEADHGNCTQTFVRKVRKQLRAVAK